MEFSHVGSRCAVETCRLQGKRPAKSVSCNGGITLETSDLPFLRTHHSRGSLSPSIYNNSHAWSPRLPADFLPFECSCGKNFCLDHRKPSAHSCSRKGHFDSRVFKCPICTEIVRCEPGVEINEQFSRHSMTSCDPRRREINKERKRKKNRDRCNKKGCKVKLNAVNRIRCATCKWDFCVAHRACSSHDCGRLGHVKKKVSSRLSSRSSSPSFTRPRPQNGSQTIIPNTRKNASERCPQCGMMFFSVDLLVAHVVAFHESSGCPPAVAKSSTSSTTEPCPICGRSFTNAVALLGHVQQDHHPRGAPETTTLSSQVPRQRRGGGSCILS